MAARHGSSFSVNRQFFALLSTDGRLRVWDSSSGKLIQEFSPALKAESSCTCLCWTRGNRGPKSKEPKRKKRKSVITSSQNEQYPLLVLGTNSGVILSYDVVAGELGDSFIDGHSNNVTDVKYNEANDTLYSCSKDRYIIEWSLEEKVLCSKWKGDKVAVNCIAVGPSGNTLLSAGQSIKLWNLKTKELLQQFHGHISSITLLQFSSFCLPSMKDADFDDGYYFLTGSSEDRIINAWQVNYSQKDKTAIATYRLSDVPVFVDSLLVSSDDRPLKLCAGCRDGRIHFFENTMNGRTSRPIEATKTLDLLQKEGVKSNTTPTPFLDAVLYEENGVELMLVYGSSLKPVFKKYVYSKLDITSKCIQELSENMLLADVVSDSDNGIDTELAKQNIKTKMIGNTSIVLPGLKNCLNPVLDVNDNEQNQSKTGTTDVTLGEQLRGTWPEKDKLKLRPTSSTPSAGSFSQMLIQALHSSDEALINEVLFKVYPDTVLRSTVKRIPNNLVGRLLTIVVDKLQRNPARSKDLSCWLRTVMAVHLTYLITNETLYNTLTSLFHLLSNQRDVHPLLLSLQGKIDLLYAHASNINFGDEDDLKTAEVVFNDDSENETEELFDKLIESDDDDDGKEDSGVEHDEVIDVDKKISDLEDDSEDETADEQSGDNSDQY